MHGGRHSGHPDIPRREGGRTLSVDHAVLVDVRYSDQYLDVEQSDDRQWTRSDPSDVRGDERTGHVGQFVVERGAIRGSTLLGVHDRGIRLFVGYTGGRTRRDPRKTHHAADGIYIATDPVVRSEHSDRGGVETILHHSFPNNSETCPSGDHVPVVQQLGPVGIRHRDHAELDLAGAPTKILRCARLGRDIQDRSSVVDLLSVPQLRAAPGSVEQVL